MFRRWTAEPNSEGRAEPSDNDGIAGEVVHMSEARIGVTYRAGALISHIVTYFFTIAGSKLI